MTIHGDLTEPTYVVGSHSIGEESTRRQLQMSRLVVCKTSKLVAFHWFDVLLPPAYHFCFSETLGRIYLFSTLSVR